VALTYFIFNTVWLFAENFK